MIEEAPARWTRRVAGMGGGGRAARSADYVGAGTVEFIVPADQPDEFFFMEMNTRLQVEQSRHRDGSRDRSWSSGRCASPQANRDRHPGRHRTMTGHAIEARVYAEDPANGFLPTGGTVLELIEPEGVR